MRFPTFSVLPYFCSVRLCPCPVAVYSRLRLRPLARTQRRSRISQWKATRLAAKDHHHHNGASHRRRGDSTPGEQAGAYEGRERAHRGRRKGAGGVTDTGGSRLRAAMREQVLTVSASTTTATVAGTYTWPWHTLLAVLIQLLRAGLCSK